jgi:GNAT superfamily N-acetyltransferase
MLELVSPTHPHLLAHEVCTHGRSVPTYFQRETFRVSSNTEGMDQRARFLGGPVPLFRNVEPQMKSSEVIRAETPDQIRSCYPVILQLRPHLPSEESYCEQVQRQAQQGYQLIFLQTQNQVTAVAGYRFLECLAWGKILYIDDLVTDDAARNHGCGSLLLSWIIDAARKAQCNQVHLDSGPQRHEAHRLYLNHGFQIRAYHFALEL